MKAEYRWIKGDGIYSKDKEKSVLMKFKEQGDLFGKETERSLPGNFTAWQ